MRTDDHRRSDVEVVRWTIRMFGDPYLPGDTHAVAVRNAFIRRVVASGVLTHPDVGTDRIARHPIWNTPEARAWEAL